MASQEQQNVIINSSNNAMAADDIAQFTIQKGIFDVDLSSLILNFTYADPAATQQVLYRADFPTCFQSQCTIYKDGDLIANIENLTAACAIYYKAFHNLQTNKNIYSANDFNQKKWKVIGVGTGAGNPNYSIQFPFRVAFPFLVLPNEKYIVINDVMTIQIQLKTLDILIDRTLATNALAALAVNDVNPNLVMCQLPDVQVNQQPLQSCVQQLSITSTSQQFNFKVKKNVLSQYQALMFASSDPLFQTVINYGGLIKNNVTDGASSAKIKKNGNKLTDPKFNNAYGVNAGTENLSVFDFVAQLQSANKQKNSDLAVCCQEQYYNQASINFRTDLTSTTDPVISALFQYVQQPEI